MILEKCHDGDKIARKPGVPLSSLGVTLVNVSWVRMKEED